MFATEDEGSIRNQWDKRVLTSTDVTNDVTVQVRLSGSASPLIHKGRVVTHHNHNIKLLRPRDKLHRGVVDNHRVELDTGVSVFCLGDALTGVEEETVTEFHDVGFVDAGDLL